MKKNIIYSFFVLAAALLTLSSCTEAGVALSEDIDPHGLSLSFSLGEGTRATEDGDDALNENTINSIDVFIFEEGAFECTFYEHFEITPVSSGTASTTRRLDAIQSQFKFGTNYQTFVVANYTGTRFQELGSSIDRGTLIAAVDSGINPDAEQASFLMDGMYTMMLNDGVVKNKMIPVGLKRAAAKIRIGINYDQSKFSAPVGVDVQKLLVNYVPATLIVDSGGLLDGNQETMQAFTSFAAGVQQNGKAVMYSYENNWTGLQEYATYLIMNIPVTDISSGTTYANNYYKVPVNYSYSQDGSTDVYKLKRNTLYDITVNVDVLGSDDPGTALTLDGSYRIVDWTTKDVYVSVEGADFIYVKDTNISLPNRTIFTTTFQSSTPDVIIADMKVNGVPANNGDQDVLLYVDAGVKSGNITIDSRLPSNFVAKVITFTVQNGVPLSVDVTVTQYPPVYLGSHDSADTPGGGQGQNNNKMYILGNFVADFSSFPDPDEFDEQFPSGYTHWAPDPELGRSYAQYIRTNAVLGYPLTDATGATIDTGENNRRVSPEFMLASQYGTTTAMTYADAVEHCRDYREDDATTGLTYTDWRVPTLAEVYMIDILQNVTASEVKKILEGSYYWSARASSSVKFMDPRVGNSGAFGPLFTSVRCVRDVKE